jgi:hypothetical protein
MPNDPQDIPKPAVESEVAPQEKESPPEEPSAENEGEVGEFITRHVLDKDTVFFEG